MTTFLHLTIEVRKGKQETKPEVSFSPVQATLNFNTSTFTVFFLRLSVVFVAIFMSFSLFFTIYDSSVSGYLMPNVNEVKGVPWLFLTRS